MTITSKKKTTKKHMSQC